MIRAVLLALASALITFLIFAGSSEGRCGVKCLNRQVNALHLQYLPIRVKRLEERLDAQDAYVAQLQERIAKLEQGKAGLSTFLRCTAEVPLTRYGQPQGPSGYLFQLDRPEGATTFPTTALDLTYPRDPVGAWALVNGCNLDRVTAKSALLR